MESHDCLKWSNIMIIGGFIIIRGAFNIIHSGLNIICGAFIIIRAGFIIIRGAFVIILVQCARWTLYSVSQYFCLSVMFKNACSNEMSTIKDSKCAIEIYYQSHTAGWNRMIIHLGHLVVFRNGWSITIVRFGECLG